MQNRNILYYGTEAKLPKRIVLSAGPVNMFYEYGDLRYIRLGEHEILRRVYIAIRDHNWDTARNIITHEQLEIGVSSFEINYDVENRLGDINFVWHAVITGNEDGVIEFSFEGEAQSSYLHNRTGFCLLHPIRECSGNTFWVQQADGVEREGVFPKYLTFGELQPFTDMRSMRYKLASGNEIKIVFGGDLFEMEDQRNWTDGSYKTYCTPLRFPIPAQVQKGQKISQSISIVVGGDNIPGKTTVISQSDTEIVQISVDTSSVRRMPGIGLGCASIDATLKDKEIERLKAIKPAHLRLDLFPAKPDAAVKLARAAREANFIGVPLEIALFLEDTEDEIRVLASMLAKEKPQVCRWMVFGPGKIITSKETVLTARCVLNQFYPDVPIGGGSNANFAELNQFRAPFEHLDFVSYPITPQVHTYDNDSLVEALESQALTVASAVYIAGDLPVVVSPVTLKMRFNPDAIGPAAELDPGELPSQVDVRQMSLFGAGWTVGSLQRLMKGGASSITYFETIGWRGVMEIQDGSLLPEKFQSIPGAVYPMYHIFADVGEFDNGEILSITTSDTLRVVGMALRKSGRQRLVIANMTPSVQHVSLIGLERRVRVRMLDETNVEQAIIAPELFRSQKGKLQDVLGGKLVLKLLPYAIARIDSFVGE